MKHTTQGWWLEEAGAREPLPVLEREVDCDLAILGGGFTGLWTAWQVSKREPSTRIVVVEKDRCGHGPSGRNGGFVMSLWSSLENMAERFGAEPAIAAARASVDSVNEIGEFCADHDLDAWYRKAGYMMVSASPAQDVVWQSEVAACHEYGVPEVARELEPGEVAERCRSPLFRGGAYFPDSATVQPGRLALGLRKIVSGLPNVEVYESSPVRSIEAGAWGCRIEAGGGAVSSKVAVLAMGGAMAGSGSPLKGRMTVASSHIALTEPVPDLLEEIGWTGGESITDGRRLVHYFRTTDDGRIAFGWGGGEIACGARIDGRAEVDREVIDQVVADLLRTFPGLEGRQVTHAWGGPIDASPTHLPSVVRVGSDPVFAAFGYTGNGVGPSHLAGKILASLILGVSDDLTRLPLVNPEPQRVPGGVAGWLGGSVIRNAMMRREAAEDFGESPASVDRLVSEVPEMIGFHIGR